MSFRSATILDVPIPSWADGSLAHRTSAQSSGNPDSLGEDTKSWRRSIPDTRVEEALRASRGPRILRVDRNIWVFVSGHVLGPALLYVCHTHLTDAVNGAMQLQSLESVLYTALLLLSLAGQTALYRSLYASDPGFVDVHSSSLIGPLGNYCQYCALQPPLRSRHNFQTGQCVIKFDHFCHLLATPIGDCNHARFLVFIAFQTLLLIWGTVLAWHAVSGCFWPFSSPAIHAICWRQAPLRTLVLVLVLGAMLAMLQAFVGLLVLHCYLAATNQTTYELLKGSKVSYLRPFFRVYKGPSHVHNTAKGFARLIWRLRKGNAPPAPFSRGVAKNLNTFLFAPKPCWYEYQKPVPRMSTADEL